MEQYLTFIAAHWGLVTAFVGIALIWVLLELRERATGFPKLTPQQAVDAINRQNAKILDLRKPDDFKAGHIVGAVNVPVDDLENQGKKLQKLTKKPIILQFNGSQPNLSKVSILLRELGFQDISLLSGGLEAWRSANLPLTKD